MTCALSEPAARRFARLLGLRIMKSRSRNPENPAYGGFMLIDARLNAVICGAHPYAFSLSLDQVWEELRELKVGTAER